MTHRTLLFLIGSLLAFACLAQAETLVVFTDPDRSELAQSFQTIDLAAIRRVAESEGVEVRVVDAGNGAPELVRITPLIVFQNARGRSFYQGRYTSHDRLRTFIRTARVIPQGEETLDRTNVPVWSAGRATLAGPIKITPLNGDVADDAMRRAFTAEAETGLRAGFEQFTVPARVALERSDRCFYFDVYPHRSGDRLYLSLAIFSQFNCHEPVATRMDEPIQGGWADRADLLAQAARWFETTTLGLLADPESGDGWDPLATDVPVRSWDALGLALPERPTTSSSAAGADITLPARWRVGSPAREGQPPVVYRFPPPLDSYVGEAREISGWLQPGAGHTLSGVSGRFDVPTASITTGEPLLDDAIAGSVILDVAKHPTSSFVIASVEMDRPTLRFGEVATGIMRGQFLMKGIAMPLDVLTTLEPIIDADGRARLALTASWQIRLKERYGIIGPDGPAPANDTVLLRCDLLLEPDRM